MSTVKIKTEPAAAIAAVEVKVKLEPSLSTVDIKLEQHTSDIDTKVESDSDADSDEGDIKSESDDDDDDDGDDTDQNQTTDAPKNQRRWVCKHPGCGRGFNSTSNLSTHQHIHRLQTDVNVLGKTYNLTRQSLGNRWPCPIPDCNMTYKSVCGVRGHIRRLHDSTIKQLLYHQKQPLAKKTRHKYHFLDVDDFYVNRVRCGYHSTIGVFLCHDCKLVPECLLTHLQQKHGYDEKSIDSAILPESAVNASADPNINQHTSNPHLAAAIRNPYQQQHPDIIQGWLCTISDCGFCCPTKKSRRSHQYSEHKGEQQSTVPALVLRLLYAKTQASWFLITQLDIATSCVMSADSASQTNCECDDEEDDGDELVLSDYSD